MYFAAKFLLQNGIYNNRSPGSQANNSYVTHSFVSLFVRDILQLFVYIVLVTNSGII